MLRIGMIFVVCATIAFVGCSSSSTTAPGGGGEQAQASALFGTWEGSIPELKGMKLVMVFSEDGKFSQETVIEGVPMGENVKIDGGKQEGTYKHEDKTITVTVKEKDKKMTIKELTDGKMVLANEAGKEMTFAKKK